MIPTSRCDTSKVARSATDSSSSGSHLGDISVVGDELQSDDLVITAAGHVHDDARDGELGHVGFPVDAGVVGAQPVCRCHLDEVVGQQLFVRGAVHTRRDRDGVGDQRHAHGEEESPYALGDHVPSPGTTLGCHVLIDLLGDAGLVVRVRTGVA
jgi:hypothetical protein